MPKIIVIKISLSIISNINYFRQMLGFFQNSLFVNTFFVNAFFSSQASGAFFGCLVFSSNELLPSSLRGQFLKVISNASAPP